MNHPPLRAAPLRDSLATSSPTDADVGHARRPSSTAVHCRTCDHMGTLAARGLHVWLVLLLVPMCGSNLPTIDLATLMRALQIPADVPPGTVVYRVIGDDSDSRCDYPLHFEITSVDSVTCAASSGAEPVLRAEDLPCTCQDTHCQANVVLVRPLELGRIYDLQLKVRDSTGAHNIVPSTVRATNATTPINTIFPRMPQLITVPEDAKPGTVLDYVIVTNHPLRKSHPHVEIWGSPLFNLSTAALHSATTIKVDILLTGQLDFEKQSMYMLTLVALNAYAEPDNDTRNVASISVAVAVQDVQDTPPIFSSVPPVSKIPISAKRGDMVLRVQADDGDHGNPRTLRYGLVSEGSPLVTYFSVDERTGEVTLNRTVEELAAVTHSHQPIVLTVLADEVRMDQNEPPAQAATARVALILEPSPNSPPYFKTTRFETHIPENSIQGTKLHFDDSYIAEIRDDDVGKFGVFSISLNESDTFEVSPHVGEQKSNFELRVRNNHLLDFEKHHNISLKVIAKELGPDESLSSFAEVIVHIEDVNDNAPEFELSNYEVTLLENVTQGVIVTQVRAHDKDSDRYGKIRYTQILGFPSTSLKLDSVTGLITIATVHHEFDRENAAEYLMHVEARDMNGSPQGNAAQVPLLIKVQDVNDEPPVFDRKLFEFVLRSDYSDFTAPAFIKATDADADAPNNVINYYMKGNNFKDKFHLDKLTGRLSVKERMSVDYSQPRIKRAAVLPELDTVIELQVEAVDLGIPPQSAQTTVHIYPPQSKSRLMRFIVAGAPVDKSRIHKLLAAVMGSNVNIISVSPYVEQQRLQEERTFQREELANKTLVIAEIENGGEPIVDLSQFLGNISNSGTNMQPEPTEATVTVVKEYRADSSALFWILIVMAILLIIVIIILILCCICDGCPLYVSPRKRARVASAEDVVHLDVHEGHHGMETKSVQVAEWSGQTREAWSADIRQQRSWRFNKRNNLAHERLGNDEDFHSFRSLPGPRVIYSRELQALHQHNAPREKDIYVEDIEGGHLEGPRHSRIKADNDMDTDSMRRHEMERGSDVGRGPIDGTEYQRGKRERHPGTEKIQSDRFISHEREYTEKKRKHKEYKNAHPEQTNVHFSQHQHPNHNISDDADYRNTNSLPRNLEHKNEQNAPHRRSSLQQMGDLRQGEVLIAADENDIRRLAAGQVVGEYRLVLERTSPQEEQEGRTPVGREHYYIRDGNAEILRLVTRGRSDEENLQQQTNRPVTFLPPREQYIRIDNGKEIIMQKFMEDQRMNTAQELASLQQQEMIIRRILEEQARRSTAEANTSDGAQTVIGVQEVSLQTENMNANAEQKSESVKLIGVSTQVSSHGMDTILKPDCIIPGDSVIGGMYNDHHETQSLPAQTSMATQTEVDVGTQTVPIKRRAVSDNDDSFTEEEEEDSAYPPVILITKSGLTKGIRWVRRDDPKRKRHKRENYKRKPRDRAPKRLKIKTPIIEETESALEYADRHISAAKAPEDITGTSNYTENKSSMLRRRITQIKLSSSTEGEQPMTEKLRKQESFDLGEDSLSDSLEEHSSKRNKMHENSKNISRSSSLSSNEYEPEMKESKVSTTNKNRLSVENHDPKDKKIGFDSEVRYYYRRGSTSVHSSPERWIKVRLNRPRSRSLSGERSRQTRRRAIEEKMDSNRKFSSKDISEINKKSNTNHHNEEKEKSDPNALISRTKSTSEIQRIKRQANHIEQEKGRAKSVVEKNNTSVSNDKGNHPVHQKSGSRYMEWYKSKREERERKRKEEEEKKLKPVRIQRTKNIKTPNSDGKTTDEHSKEDSTGHNENKSSVEAVSEDNITSEPKAEESKAEETKAEDDLDSGIAMSSLTAGAQGQTGKKMKNQQLLEKKSVFTIAYNDVHTQQLRPDTSSPSY